MFQKVPNEKQTADPPMINNVLLMDITDDPTSRGLNVDDTATGETFPVHSFIGKQQTSFKALSNWSLMMPPTTNTCLLCNVAVAPKRAILADGLIEFGPFSKIMSGVCGLLAYILISQ